MSVTSIQLNVQLVSFVAGTLIPLLVGLLAKSRASATIKVGLNIVLSAIAGALAPVLAASGHFQWQQFVYSVFTTVITSVAMYKGVWKPLGVADAVQSGTGGFGFGPGGDPQPQPQPVPTPEPVPVPQPVPTPTPEPAPIPEPDPSHPEAPEDPVDKHYVDTRIRTSLAAHTRAHHHTH